MIRQLLSTLVVVVLLSAGAAPARQHGLAQDTPAAASPRAMLQRMPLIGLGDDAAGQVTYANLALQATETGVEVPTGDPGQPIPDDWMAAVGTMSIHSRASFMTLPEWEETFGFSLFDLDQVVEYAAPPDSFSLFRGRFDTDDLVRHWAAEGYQIRETDAGPYYTIRGDFEIEMGSDTGRLVMASANYVATLAPDTIAFAATERLITEAVNLAAGTGTSFADEINVASLLEGIPDDLISGTIIPGSLLLATGDPAELLTEDPGEIDVDAIATRLADDAAAAAAMPPLTVALLGSTAGNPLPSPATGAATPVAAIPAARAVAVLVTTNDAVARTVAEVVDARLQGSGGESAWTDFFPAWEISVVKDEPVVTVELELAPERPASILIQMLYRRELGFLAWAP